MVKTQSIDSLVGLLQLKLDKLPVPLARHELICAAQYLAATCAATVDITLQTQACCADYHYDNKIPADHRVLGIEAIKYCGECIDPIDKCDPCPRGYELCSPTHIKLYPEPANDGEDIEICLTLEPTEDACELPVVFTTTLRKQLLEKAEGELLIYPDKPWTDVGTGRFKLRRAKGDRTSEAVSQARGYSRRNCMAGEAVL